MRTFSSPNPLGRPSFDVLLVFCSFFICGAVLGQYDVEGSAQLRAYIRGEPKSSADGPFSFEIQPGYFRFKLFEIDPDIEHKILIVSDYDSIYQSSSTVQRDGSVAPFPTAIGNFDSGKMPNGLILGFGMPQMYCLAHHLLVEGKAAFVNGALREELIPGRITLLAKGRSLSVRTEIVKTVGDSATEVLFWGVTPSHLDKPLRASDTCFLISRLATQEFEKTLPTKLYCVTYADRSTQFIAEYQFQGTVTRTSGSKDLTTEIAYDHSLKTGVVDTRLGRAPYELSPGERVPFQNTREYKLAANKAQEVHKTAAEQNMKRKTVFGVFIAAGVFFGFWILKGNHSDTSVRSSTSMKSKT